MHTYIKTGEAVPHLKTDGHIDPAAEGGADGPGREPQVFEDLGEGLSKCDARTFLRHHHTGPHTRQIHVP